MGQGAGMVKPIYGAHSELVALATYFARYMFRGSRQIGAWSSPMAHLKARSIRFPVVCERRTDSADAENGSGSGPDRARSEVYICIQRRLRG